MIEDRWAEHTAFLRSRPSAAGLARMAGAVFPGASVTGWRRLKGGLDAASSAVDLALADGGAATVVLKRFADAASRASAVGEHRCLEIVHRHSTTPAPEPLAIDSEGVWFGAPALVMSRLPGHPTIARRSGDWPERLGAAILPLHRVDVRRLDRHHLPRRRRPSDVDVCFEVDRLPSVWAEAAALVSERLPGLLRRRRSLVHGDYHPGNVLWVRSQLTGIVDWPDLALSRPLEDLGYVRADLVLTHGRAEADRAVVGYQRAQGGPVDDCELAVWDLLASLRARRFGRYWLSSFHESGRTDMSTQAMFRALSAFARQRLAAVG